MLVTIQGAKPGKTILLRGDMDALTVQETTGAPYASKNEGIMPVSYTHLTLPTSDLV